LDVAALTESFGTEVHTWILPTQIIVANIITMNILGIIFEGIPFILADLWICQYNWNPPKHVSI
jgi:hypothetical protein